MTPIEKADAVFYRSVAEALGYIELARDQQIAGRDYKAMADAAIKALQRFSDDDDLIDAMYEADRRVEWGGPVPPPPGEGTHV